MSSKRSSRLLPILLLVTFAICATSTAQTKSFGDWTVMISDDKNDLIAATTVDSDKWFGYRCFGKLGKCAHSLNLAIVCEDRKVYPVLVNSNYSAAAIDCTCSKNGDSYELIPNYDAIHDLVIKSSGYIGFAVPMQSGQFKVVRFSLDGVKEAMALAERAIKNVDSAEYH